MSRMWNRSFSRPSVPVRAFTRTSIKIWMTPWKFLQRVLLSTANFQQETDTICTGRKQSLNFWPFPSFGWRSSTYASCKTSLQMESLSAALWIWNECNYRCKDCCGIATLTWIGLSWIEVWLGIQTIAPGQPSNQCSLAKHALRTSFFF